MREQFDAIVIGSGQGGNPLAKEMAKQGWKTAMVERKWVGGTCVNTGCTPTKTMIASARVAYLARRSAEYGVHTGAVSVSMREVVERKRAIVNESRANNLRGLTTTENLTLICGEASFIGPHEVAIALTEGGNRELEAPHIFLDVGVRSAMPSIPGIEDVAVLDNASVMELSELPDHLLVLGGGFLSIEFAQMFRRFGSRVTIIGRGPQLAEREDADVADEILKILREDGIEVLLRAKAMRCERTASGVCLSVDFSDGSRDVLGTHLLVAAGRTPNTDSLCADRAGVRLDEQGYVEVNDRLETSAQGIYAIGDCKGGPQFTHIAYDDFRILRDNLLGAGDRPQRTTRRPMPYTLYLDPELGRVGMTEKDAREAGRHIRVAKIASKMIARAGETAETRGFLKAIVDHDTDHILGASMLSENGGELASMIQIAMMGGVTASELRDGIWSHPTWSEALNTLFSSYVDDAAS